MLRSASPPAATAAAVVVVGTRRLILSLVVAALAAAGCAHGGAAPPAGPGQRFRAEAVRVQDLRFEDQFIEARLVLQALPARSPERVPLRAKLVHYLLDPVARLDADRLKREARELDSDDVFDRIFDSLRDAASLYEPEDLWASPAAIADDERALFARAAELVATLYSPRGAEPQVALALAVLGTVSTDARPAAERLERVLAWTEEAGAAADGRGGGRRMASTAPAATAIDLLQVVLADWPAPAVARRLAGLYADRQRTFSSILKKPLPGADDARRALGELLLNQGEEMQQAVPNVAAVYLRCGRIEDANAAVAALADKPGDDPDLRALIAGAADRAAPAAAYLRLARRFLPRVDLLGGTSPDNPDPVVAFRVLELGLARAGDDPEALVLSAEVAKLLSSPFLAIRRLEEAQAVLERGAKAAAPSSELAGRVSTELIELYFLRLRLDLDPERASVLSETDADVARLRQQSADARRRFQNAEVRVKDAQIDFELARSYVNAGLIDRAEPLFVRAQGEDPEPNAEITAELGSLVMKRGNPQRAVQILHAGLEALRASPTKQETIGGVEGRSRLEKLLGDALELAGNHAGAEQAWRASATGWERLMVEHLRRKSFNRSAEATFEIGRILYLLGRHGEGIQKFDEAIEQDSDRDQSYIDAVSFLVQNGEADAALAVYRRALARSDRNVSEYVKVYASLWILDLTRRTQKLPDAGAEAFLKALDLRHPEVRPQRGAAWYRQLAAFAVGRMTHQQLMAVADTAGKRAEVYFYRAMQLLGDGKADDAHQLWQKVVETRMFSFFEFDMASRYLRLGAPTTPPAESQPATETI